MKTVFEAGFFLQKYKDGKFRGFAFIGYQTDAEAGAAKKYLDGTL